MNNVTSACGCSIYEGVNNIYFVTFRYQLMINCWNEVSDKRPTFTQLVSELDHLLAVASEQVSAFLMIRIKYWYERIVKAMTGDHDLVNDKNSGGIGGEIL